MMEEIFNRDRMIRGARWFGALTVAGLGILTAVSGRGALDVVGHLSPIFLVVAALAAVLDTLIGASRYQIFLRRIRPGVPFSLPIRADLANKFVGAVTPSQTGGGPAQLYVLWKGGIPVPDALSFLAINFLSTMIFFLVAGGFTAWMFRGAFVSGTVTLLIRYGFAAFATMGVFVFVALLRPDLIERPCRALVARRGGRGGGALHAGLQWVVDSIGRYRSACTRFVREAPILLLWSMLLTMVLYLNKFSLGYFVLRGLGVEASYLEVLAIQALLQFILYVAPSPGGSGIAELSTAALMARFMDPSLLAAYTFAFRFFLLYLPAAVGCFVLIGVLEPLARSTKLPAGLEAEGAVAP